jgi:hypothetical protein
VAGEERDSAYARDPSRRKRVQDDMPGSRLVNKDNRHSRVGGNLKF